MNNFAFFGILFIAFQATDDTPQGLDQAQFKLRQLMRFELGDSGELKLKRDHWELVAKKPAKKNENAGDNAARMVPQGLGAMRMRPDEPAVSKLFKQIMTECGAMQRSSSSSNNRSSSKFASSSRTSKGVRGQITVMSNNVSLRAEEVDGRRRTTELSDDGVQTSFQLLMPNGLVRIVTTPEGFRIDSAINDKAFSVTSKSFVAAVHKNRDYFTNVLAPAIRQVAILPIDEALRATPPEDDSEVDLKLTAFPASTWADGDSLEIISALLQFEFVEGRLRRKGDSKGKDVFEEELLAVKEKVDKLIVESVEQMKAKDASPMLIAELKRQVTPSEPGVGRANFRGRPLSIEAGLFLHFASSLGNSPSSSSSSDGSYTFTTRGPVIAEISALQGKVTNISIDNDEVRLAVSETTEATRILIESAGGILLIFDTADGANVFLVDNDQRVAVSGDSLAQIYDRNKELVETRVIPVLKKYGIGISN